MDRAFDYVVVGAGSAGCVVTNRLATTGADILLLEAGKDASSILLKMPAGFAYASKNPSFDWGLSSESEPYLGGRTMPCPRGKVVGGSSAVNAMAFVRGHPLDFADWAQQAGSEWSYVNCLPYFKKLETFSRGADAFRGGSGPLKIKAPEYSNPLYGYFLKACQQAGYDLSPDTNGATMTGFGPMDQCIDKGRRSSSSTAYLDPIRGFSNFSLRTGVQATRILLENGRATGVEYRSIQGTGIVFAQREVILCAGAVHSPTLLMLSGIGDSDHLSRFGIRTELNRPSVGKHLQDHVDVTVRQLCPLPITESKALRADQRLLIGMEWLLFKKGRGATNHFEVGGYIETRHGLDRPNIQLCFMPLLVSYDGAPALGHRHGYQISVMLLQPTSRGTVELASSDPLAAPKLTFNYLTNKDEVSQLSEGIQAVRSILSQPAMEKFRGVELAPGVSSNGAVEKFIRETAKSTHHVCGTCRMGLNDDAVVDWQGRVRGIRSLRIADSSIIPKITSGNINAPTVMLAEKISDMIVHDGSQSLTN